MLQTLLTACAMSCALVLHLSARQTTHHWTASSQKGEVELMLGQLGSELLDFAATLPDSSDVVSPSASASFWEASSLADWNHIEETIPLETERGVLEVRVAASVEAVVKDGSTYRLTNGSSPFRRVRLALDSSMDADVDLERIYVPG